MGINQTIVLGIIENYGPLGQADIKRYVLLQPHTIGNIQKVLNSLVSKGNVTFASGVYTFVPSAPRPVGRRGGISNRLRKAVVAGYTIGRPLSYPNSAGISDKSAILDYLEAKKKGLTKTTRSSIGYLVDLTEANSDIVEAQIPRGIIGLRGFRLAKRYLPHALGTFISLCPNGVRGMFDFTNRRNVETVIKQIDSDNGTQDYKHHYSATIAFTDFIINPGNNFVTRLDGSPIDSKELVRDLKASCSSYNANSLASKVCKYFHEFYYGHDKFFINDSVVRSVLPYYLDAYGIRHRLVNANSVDSLSYGELYDLLDSLYSTIPPFKSGRRMTKTEFDHLLWYCYRDYQIKN